MLYDRFIGGKSGWRLSVDGFGRVGSYASAVRGHYCRAHRYWAIVRFDPSIVPGEMRAVGHVELDPPLRFKTGKAAQQYLEEHYQEL